MGVGGEDRRSRQEKCIRNGTRRILVHGGGQVMTWRLMLPKEGFYSTSQGGGSTPCDTATWGSAGFG